MIESAAMVLFRACFFILFFSLQSLAAFNGVDCPGAFGVGQNGSKYALPPALLNRKPSEPLLIIFSAPSGGGKSTLAELIKPDFPNLVQSVSTTTRAPRGQEKEGKDYFYVTMEEFLKMDQAGELIEKSDPYNGNYYGTQKSTIQNAFANGQSVLALLERKGTTTALQKLPGKVVTVFLSPPSLKVLEARLRARCTNTEESIQERLATAKKELEEARDYDFLVVNDDLEICRQTLVKLFRDLQLVP